MRYMKKSKKFKAPNWFHKAFDEAEKREKEVFEYFSERIGYGVDWCKQNVGKCIEKLEPRERSNIIRELNRVDIANKYAWSRFFYENWDKIKELVNTGPPEYDSRKRIIKFSNITISDKVLEQARKFKWKHAIKRKN